VVDKGKGKEREGLMVGVNCYLSEGRIFYQDGSMLPPAAALSQWEVKGQRKQRVNRPQVSYRFCQELNPALHHDNRPCDCMFWPSPFL
jgi:hypothetical protein